MIRYYFLIVEKPLKIIREFFAFLRRRRLPVLALCAFLLCTAQFFWSPSPNIARVTLSDLQKDAQSLTLQLFYSYAHASYSRFSEKHSKEFVLYPGKGTIHATFTLPGLKYLHDLRLDFGAGDARFKLHDITLGYDFWPFKYDLFSIKGAAVTKIWKQNKEVEVAGISGPSASIKVTGSDPYAFMPVNEKTWRNLGDPATLLFLRVYRSVVFLILAILFYLGCRLSLNVGKRLQILQDTDKKSFAFRFFLLFVCAISILGFLVFLPFITVQKYYLFTNIANDSVNLFWPITIYLSKYIHKIGFPFWTYSIGVGQNIFMFLGDPFTFVHILLPTSWVGAAFGWLQYLKVILAAGLFYYWLRLLKINHFGAVFAATGLAFSAEMIIRGNWVHYPSEFVAFAFALIAIELYLVKNNWYFIPWALVLLILTGVFQTYVRTAILFCYVICRLYHLYGGDFAKQAKILGKLIFLYCVGLGISSIVFLPIFYSLWTSARVKSGEAVGYLASALPLFTPVEPKHWLSSIYSLFALDLMGRAGHYSGIYNYLEGPQLYAGLFALILMPQAFIGRSKRLRIILVFLSAAAIFYIFFPALRYALNAFVGDYYKTSSFWIGVLLAVCSGIALDNILKKGLFSLRVHLITAAILFWMLYKLRHSPFINTYIHPFAHTSQEVVYLLGLYTAFFLLLRFRYTKYAGLFLAVCTLCAEVYLFAGYSSQRPEAISSHVKDEGGLYFDTSQKAVDYIQSMDKGFYRIDRTASSVSLDDATGQGYFGIKSYLSFNNPQYLRFLDERGFDTDFYHKDMRMTTSYIEGVGNRPLLESLLSVKYYLSRDKEADLIPEGYRFLHKTENWSVYKNDQFMPMGIIYHAVVGETAAHEFPPRKRDILALHAAIVPDKAVKALSVPSLPKKELDLYRNETQETIMQDTSRIPDNFMKMDSFSENSFQGSVSCSRPGLLYLSIPASPGWKFSRNGTAITPVLTHFGFTGIELPQGKSIVRGKYRPPLFYTGTKTTFLGLAMYILLILLSKKSHAVQKILTP